MSTLKVNEVRHLSNTGSANIVLESNATTNLQATSTLGLTVTGTLTVSGVSTLNGNVVIGNASTDTVNLISTIKGFNNFSGFTGEIRMYAGNAAGDSPPAGWLYCNGDTISSLSGNGGTHYNSDGKGNDYQPLFNLLKATNDWGNAGSPSWGTNTVKTPDFRSRAPVGNHTGAATSITAGLTSRTLSDAVGTETHALTVAELAVHTHASTIVASSTGQTISTITASSHSHTSSAHTHTQAHTHTGSTGLETSTHYHNSQYMYGRTGVTNGKIAVGGDNQGSSYGKAQSEIGSNKHIHNFTTASPSSSSTGSTTPPATGNTTPSISGGALTDPTHTHTLTAANAAHSGTSAAGTAHTILQPIIVVNYIIKV